MGGVVSSVPVAQEPCGTPIVEGAIGKSEMLALTVVHGSTATSGRQPLVATYFRSAVYEEGEEGEGLKLGKLGCPLVTHRRNRWPHEAPSDDAEVAAAVIFSSHSVGVDQQLPSALLRHDDPVGWSTLYAVNGHALNPLASDHATVHSSGVELHAVAQIRQLVSEREHGAQCAESRYLGGLGLFVGGPGGAFADEPALRYAGMPANDQRVTNAASDRVANCPVLDGSRRQIGIAQGVDAVLVLALVAEWDAHLGIQTHGQAAPSRPGSSRPSPALAATETTGVSPGVVDLCFI